MLNYRTAYGGEALGDLGAEEEWVVLVKPGVADLQIQEMCGVARNGCRLSGKPSQGGVPFFEMRGSEKDLEAVIVSGRGSVEAIEPDVTIFETPEVQADGAIADLWGLKRVAAYGRASDGAGVSVFVLDTGVRVTHQEFGGRAFPALDVSTGELHECGGEMSCAGDKRGHGSHCAGTVAGDSFGVAPGATILSAKVLGDGGGGQLSWSYAALDWIATSSIRPAVVSMSLGISGRYQGMKRAVEAATDAAVTVVTAAGNANNEACRYSPAYLAAAITVGSTDSTNRRSSFSNHGECVDLWAPGRDVYSVGIHSDRDTAVLSGTSMSCPHVAGGAALVLQRNPAFNSAKVLEALRADSRADSLTDLYHTDSNRELYVGADAPPPAGGVTPPAPTPPPAGECWGGCREIFCHTIECMGCSFCPDGGNPGPGSSD